MKRGGPPRRRTPLAGGGGLTRRQPKPKRPDPARDAHWRKVRHEVEARTWCEASTPACPPGRHHGAHAHHVILRSQGGPDEAWNLLWVCHLAHDFIHAHPADAYAAGWLRRSTDRP